MDTLAILKHNSCLFALIECNLPIKHTHTHLIQSHHTHPHCYSDDSDDCSDELEVAEMPFDLDIEVEALALEDHEIDGLRADTLYVDHMFYNSI